MAPKQKRMDRRKRLEMLIPFWAYVTLIVLGLTAGIIVGLTHN